MAASNHTNVQAQSKEGHQLNLQHTSTDSPILPAENLRQLQEIDPVLVGWVIHQTELEASHRRKQESRINIFILVEKLSGVAAGLIAAVFGLAMSGYLVMQNHDFAGISLGGVGLATIVSILVARHKNTNRGNNGNGTSDSSEKKKVPSKK
ncbi:hypothetical protein [Undibacterium sp. SXout20W]|uniref:hypothetical protein n=1 Tax=Undibacterium sp. SXout20W TaxID=3413051 RepID=UPI003BF3F65F